MKISKFYVQIQVVRTSSCSAIFVTYLEIWRVFCQQSQFSAQEASSMTQVTTGRGNLVTRVTMRRSRSSNMDTPQRPLPSLDPNRSSLVLRVSYLDTPTTLLHTSPFLCIAKRRQSNFSPRMRVVLERMAHGIYL